MRHVRRQKHQVVRVVRTDMIRNEPKSAAVQSQGQFAFRMVMPLKGNPRNAAVEHTDRTAFGDCDVFEMRFHPLHWLPGFGHSQPFICPNSTISWLKSG